MKTKIVGSLEWREEVPDQTFTWDEAKAYAESMGDGWRLPTVQELLTLVDYARYAPACSVFPDCPRDSFWSSSASAGGTGYAWLVNFDVGYADFNGADDNSLIRLVRNVKPDTVEDVPDTVERLEAARERALRQAVRYRAERNALQRVVERLSRERDEALARAQGKPEYVFRGGYVEDASGDRWWSSGLLAQTETERVKAAAERDALRAEVERLRAALAEPADCRECEIEAKSHALTRIERDEALKEAAAWRATARDKGESSRQAAAERDEARAEVERLRAAPAEPLDCRECEVEADARFSEFKKTLVRRIPPGSRGDA